MTTWCTESKQCTGRNIGHGMWLAIIVYQFGVRKLKFFVERECLFYSVVPLRPMGLNSPRVFEFHFSYFILLRCPSETYGNLLCTTNICIYDFTKEYKK